MKKSGKLLRVVFCIMLAVVASISLFACVNEDPSGPSNPSGPSEPGPSEPDPSKPELKKFEGVTFEGKTFTYDGTEKQITVSVAGTLPDGASTSYQNNSATDAGTYDATATLACNGYETKTLTATLTIEKADITANITLSDKTVEYDAQIHSLQIVGNVPAGVTPKYFYDGAEASGVSEAGTHSVRCELSGKNYNTKTLTATLTITATEKQLYSAVANGKVFFQNDLDGGKLYTNESGSVKKIGNDVPNYMVSDGSNLYYFATSMFSKVIKNYNGSAASVLYNLSGEYLATDGTYLYYAVNKLIGGSDTNGIYKIALNGGSDATPTRLTSDKAEYLAYCNGYIYYSNKSEHGYLYRISVSAGNVKGTLLHEEKADYVISDGSSVFFNSTKTAVGSIGVAAAVSKYSPSQQKVIKLTTDSGKYLTKVGEYIYYVNNDKLTAALFGDGICRVSANLTSDSSKPGDKIISAENGDGYSSLASDGTNLYYYKLNDKHFYRYNVSRKSETDLMANFVPPTDPIFALSYSEITEYKGEIYYTDPKDNSCLYKYNPSTKATFKVLAESVSGAYFNGKYLYYNSFVLTNYAFNRLDLETGESEKLSSSRYENLIFGNDGLIYCVRLGANTNSIVSFDPETKTEKTEFVEGTANKNPNVVGFEKVGEDFYYIMNPKLGYQYIYKYNAASKTAGELNSIKAKNLVVFGERIYYYGSDEGLKSCKLDGTDIKTLYGNVDINDMYAKDGKVYFSSDKNNNKGFFVYDIATDTTEKIDGNPANGIAVYDGYVYFLRSSVTYTAGIPTQDISLNGKLYRYDGTQAEELK